MKLKITIDSKTYEVDVEAEEEVRGPAAGGYAYYQPRTGAAVPSGAPARPAAASAPAAPTAVADESRVCRSPIAGVVVRVNTQIGQQIQVNDPLMVLEAMKMETTVTSPVAGSVKAINAAQGEAVTVGQVLVEFE